MRYIGIDYGSKRVGIALSDETGNMAFPKQVVENNGQLVEKLLTLIQHEGVGAVVVGESRDYNQQENSIMEAIHQFKARLEAEVTLPVYLEPEFMSSSEAKQLQGRNDMIDASAATIILQSFLDKLKFKNKN